MNSITYAVSVDVNNPIIPYNVYVANVLDSNVRYLEITLYQNGNVIALSNEATATASLVTDNVLVDDSVECTISNNIISVPLEDLQRHGNLDVQVTVTEGTKVLAIPFPIQVRVTPNIAENAQIDENSLGSYAEVVHEIAEARGTYTTLHDVIAAKLDNSANAVKTMHITDSAVTTAKIANGVVTTAKVADDLAAVINAKAAQADLDKLYRGVDVTSEALATKIVAFGTRAGTQYLVRNTSAASVAINLWTLDSAGGTPEASRKYANGLTGGSSKLFTPNEDGAYLRIFLNGAGSISVEEVTAIVQAQIDIADHEQRIEAIERGNGISVEKSSAGHYYLPFTVEKGRQYILKNTSQSAGVALFTCDSVGGESKETVSNGLSAGQSRIFRAEKDSTYLHAYLNDAGSFDFDEHPVTEQLAGLESDAAAIDSTVSLFGAPVTYSYTSAGIKTIPIPSVRGMTVTVENPADSQSVYSVGLYLGSTKLRLIRSELGVGQSVSFGVKENADNIKLYCNAAGGKAMVYDTEGTYGKSAIKKYPMFRFSYQTSLKDVSASNALMDWSGDRMTILPQVYALFDALMAANTAYITKTDVVEELEMTYPDYANGIEEATYNSERDVTYQPTPAYKTYLYKLIDTNTYAGNGSGKAAEKKKLLIIAGEHGNEIAAPFNCYLLAKELCECTDPDVFAMRAAYDIYILPCLNGYGIYHRLRGNANLVNINRNYPVSGWTENGANTKSDQPDAMNQYTGPSAGSEFETQLVMALMGALNPDIFVDHHNYSASSHWQHYVETVERNMAHDIYCSIVDCSREFKKKLPVYFGGGYGLLIDASGSFPGTVYGVNETSGTSYRWAKQSGYQLSVVIEVSQSINYLNGSPVNSGQDSFGDTTFSVALFTLENTLKHVCEYSEKGNG